MPRIIVITALAALTVLLSGCELITGVREDRAVGAIGYPDDLDIALPDSARAGQDFVVTVRTFGSNGCWRKDRTAVTVRGLDATVTPHDVERWERGQTCTQGIVEISHTATLRFGQPGEARIEIRGRDGTAVRSVVIE